MLSGDPGLNRSVEFPVSPASSIHFLMYWRSMSLALVTEVGSLGSAALRSRWCAPSGMMRDTTDLLIVRRMPPDDQGSRRPLVKTMLEAPCSRRSPYMRSAMSGRGIVFHFLWQSRAICVLFHADASNMS